jgi:hypothetical protein
VKEAAEIWRPGQAGAEVERVSNKPDIAFLNVAPHKIWITDVKTTFLRPLFCVDIPYIYAELTDPQNL